MLQSVIFDLDGLLIDSEIVAYRIYCDILRPYGYDFSLATMPKNTAAGQFCAI